MISDTKERWIFMEENEEHNHTINSKSEFSNAEGSAPAADESETSINVKADSSNHDQSDELVIENIEDEVECEEKEPSRRHKKGRGKPQLEKEIDIEALQKELDGTNQKACEYFEGWQRERADFSNYRKRIERDHNEMRMNARADVIKKYLVILDDLDLALKSRPDQKSEAAWVNGIELIYRKLKNFLEAEGVKPIPETKEFDPNLHEAITHEDNPDYQNGEIIEIVQQGYMLGDRILRPARVRVAK
jgi:molecular chaperone GrpE